MHSSPDSVKHLKAQFNDKPADVGEGVIIDMSGSGDKTEVRVRFPLEGVNGRLPARR